MTTAQSVEDVGPKLAAPFLDLLPIEGLAISVLDRQEKATVVHASDGTAAALEESHFDLGEGPLFDCFSSGRPVLIPDIATEDRWPLFLSRARDLGAAGVFLFPLTLGAVCVGAALCYRRVPGRIGGEEIERGSALGRAIAGPALRRAIAQFEGEDTDHNAPIETRREVHQATGMVLSQLDTTATDAFARMRAYAFSNSVSLREVARDVVTRRLDFSTARD